MKSLKIITVILLMGIIYPISAQEKGISEVKAGYGYFTSTQTIYDFGEMFQFVFSFDNESYENEKSTGAIYFGYNYAVSDRFTIGGVFAYEQINADTKSGNDKVGKMKSTFYTVAIESCYHYFLKENFSMYSGLGLGYSFGNTNFVPSSSSIEKPFKNNANTPNFHITGFGVKFGKKFGGFAEVGFGYKGLINAGISLKL